MNKYIIELRNRICLVCLASISILFVSWVYKEILIYALMTLDSNANVFVLTNSYQIFEAYLRLILWLGLDTFVVYCFYHSFNFISPLLFKKDYQFLKLAFQKLSVCAFLFLFIIHRAILPNAFQALYDSNSSDFAIFHFEYKLHEFVVLYIDTFHTIFVVFHFFFFFLFVIIVKPRTPFFLKNVRRFYYVSLFLTSIYILPGDLYFQTSVLLSVMFAFELISIFNLFLNPDRKTFNKVVYLNLKSSKK